jgi:ADP-ribose pyrophosphatase YjhB (NUDIX family)
VTAGEHPLSQEEYDAIYAKVPRLTVEIIVKNDAGEIYLTKRAIEPCKGQWHLPGGTVRFGEPLAEAVKRIALRELGIGATEVESKGCIEYPSHYLHGLDSPVGIVFEVIAYRGQLAPDEEASDGGWFTTLPDPRHADQDVFLVTRGYLCR